MLKALGLLILMASLPTIGFSQQHRDPNTDEIIEIVRRYKNGDITQEEFIRLITADTCGEKLLLERSSVSKQNTASVFRRNCGGTTRYSTHVNLRPASKQFLKDEYGAIKDGQVFHYEGVGDIAVQWLDDSTLQISCNDCETKKTRLQQSDWNGIRILHKAASSKTRTGSNTPRKP